MAKISGVATILGFGIFGFYVNHLEEDPLTGRKRFLAFSEEQMKEIAFADQTVVRTINIELVCDKLVQNVH